MNFRTDLAVEAAEPHVGIPGVETYEEKCGKSYVIRMSIKNKDAAEKIGKPIGNYITITVPPLTDYFQSSDERIKVISQKISELIPPNGTVLVAGLGNTDITPDALGPKTVDNVLATRHISKDLAKAIGLEGLRSVAVLTPGVLGKTGIETLESLSSAIKAINPSCIIIVDAMASRRLSRLGCTIQISDTGIAPGAGVGNARPVLNKEVLKIPVIGVGVPTVVDALTLACDIMKDSDCLLTPETKNVIPPKAEQMIVTPKEIDLLVGRASLLIGMAINCALHPDFSPDELYSLIS